MPDLDIRPAVTADVPGILDVLRAALGETPLLKRTPEQWRWKHVDNPFGPSIVLLAWIDGRIAGVRALMRWHLTSPDGSRLSCARPVDTATHPDFERRGVFRALTTEAIALARQEGIHLIFNTPNPQSGAGYLSMGWGEVGTIGVMARPHIGKAVPLATDAQPDLDVDRPGIASFSPIDMPDRPPRGLRTPRTVEYQRWRFSGHPTVRYGLVAEGDGGAVVRAGARRGRTELVLSDLLGGAGRRAVSATADDQSSVLPGRLLLGRIAGADRRP